MNGAHPNAGDDGPRRATSAPRTRQAAPAQLPPPTTTKVALIGLGPSGMFFLHALATRRRELERSGDVEGLGRLPLVTCYEMCDAPGGIWRPLSEATVAAAAEGRDEGRGDESKGGEPKQRRQQQQKRKHIPNMYDNLWSNVPKELVEFPDYTYQEHFGVDNEEVPTFLPRADVLDYILHRATSVDGDLLRAVSWSDSGSGSGSNISDGTTSVGGKRRIPRRQHVIRYGITVQNVTYNSATRKFEVVSLSTAAAEGSGCCCSNDGMNNEVGDPVPAAATMEQFDYCVWAAGQHGKPRIPRPLLDLLRNGALHEDISDSDVSDSDDDSDGEEGKDARSGKDAKEEKIKGKRKKEEEKKQNRAPVPFRGTILHSSHMTEFISAVQNKRIVLIGDSSSAEDLALQAVREGVEMVYILSRSGYGDAVDMGSWPGTVTKKGGRVRIKPKVEVHIALPYCVTNDGSGLKCCEMIWNQEDEVYEIDEEEEPFVLERIDTVIFCTGYVPNLDCLEPALRFPDHEDCFWSVSDTFRMRPNPLTPEVGGHVEPSRELDLSGRVVPGVCRNMLMSNPRMMFLTDIEAEYPLLELDVAAWLCLAHITGDAPTPSREEMEHDVQEQMNEEMHYPYLRWEMDMNYFEILNRLEDGHWSDDCTDRRTVEIIEQQARYYTRLLARNMKRAKYPADFGTFKALNEDGKKHVQLALLNTRSRTALDRKSADAASRTFRDVDPNPFMSIYTGQKAGPLPVHWLDLDKNGELTTFASSTRVSAEPVFQRELSPQAKSAFGPSGPTVAVIGCGPSGMFFLHALATRRQKLIDSKDSDGLAALPRVTCYEAADGPGGIWRSQQQSTDEDHFPNIYDDCWSNKPKELIEFCDYTFQEHFGRREAPVYLPKADTFSYIMKRTKTVDPNLYSGASWCDEGNACVDDDGEEKKVLENGVAESSMARDLPGRHHVVKFSTRVQRVAFNSVTRKFEIEFIVEGNDAVAIKEQFDYCIWAAGQYAKPRIPRPLIKLLRTGKSRGVEDSDDEDENDPIPFKGTILHSSHMSNFDSAVRGKRVVLIGDSFSAEDIALNALKLGVKSVDILSRSGYGVCVETGSWPGKVNGESGEVEPKVKVHIALPYRVINDGTGLKCAEMCWNQENDAYEMVDEAPRITLESIDTIIFCTGYLPNQDFLSPDLQFKDLEHEESFWTAPPDFKMRPNPLTSEIGDVEPSEELDFSGNIVPGVYCNVLVKNPRMMYLTDMDTAYNLLQLDVGAWMCLAYITGDALIPSKEEMEKDLQAQMVEEMHIPYLRWCMDPNYFDVLDKLGDDHWSEDCRDNRTRAMDEQHAHYSTRVLARNMRKANYLADFGGYESLNELGEKFVQIELQNDYARSMLDQKAPDAVWKTFRDVDPRKFRSIHTGQVAAPLPCHWLVMDKNGRGTVGSKNETEGI